MKLGAYDRACADGCGILVETPQDWQAALQALIDDPDQRLSLVQAAQRKLETAYSPEALTQQVLDKFAMATQLSQARI